MFTKPFSASGSCCVAEQCVGGLYPVSLAIRKGLGAATPAATRRISGATPASRADAQPAFQAGAGGQPGRLPRRPLGSPTSGASWTTGATTATMSGHTAPWATQRPPNALSKPPEMPFYSLSNWTCFRGRVSGAAVARRIDPPLLSRSGGRRPADLLSTPRRKRRRMGKRAGHAGRPLSAGSVLETQFCPMPADSGQLQPIPAECRVWGWLRPFRSSR